MSIYASELRIFLFPKDFHYCDYCFFSNITLVIFLPLKKGNRETFQIRKMIKTKQFKTKSFFQSLRPLCYFGSEDYCWAIPRRTAILGRPVTRAEQAQCISSPSKNQFNIVVAWSHVSDIKLIRTDTTL